MAEETDSTAIEPQGDATSTTTRTPTRRSAARRSTAVTAPAAAPRKATPRRLSSKPRPMRSLAIIAMVGGLVATVALPAYGAFNSPDETLTLQQVAADDAQTFVAASDATASTLSRESYSATTPEEIATKKAEEAAKAAAEAAAAAAVARARASSSSSSASIPQNVMMVSPGSGEVRWPLLNFTKGRGLWDSGYHQGVDLLAAGRTPIYAAAAGVVRVSQESYGGYGVAVTIDHVIAGQSVNTLYGHMTYGTRQVVAGQTVAAGQLIGLVGSTGNSTANHTHFEVHINGGVVDPWAWLQANAG